MSTLAKGNLVSGTTLGPYRIDGSLGEGGMGVVYRATQVTLGREVALKVLRGGLASDPDARGRFLQEGRLAVRVTHPHLVRVLDVGESRGQLYLAFELVAGQTLRQRLDRDGPMGPGEAGETVLACAEAVGELHRSGIVHRDLKPSNIYLDPERGVLVGDLGIAKDRGGAGLVTRPDLILGTPAYLAPETARGCPASESSDLYALGLVFFECLIGRPPFLADDPLEVLRQQADEPVPSVCLLRSGLSPHCDGFLQKALAKDPSARFPNVSRFARALRHALQADPATPAAEVPTRQLMPASRQSRSADPTRMQATAASPRPARGLPAWALPAGLCLGLFLATAGLVAWWRSPGEAAHVHSTDAVEAGRGRNIVTAPVTGTGPAQTGTPDEQMGAIEVRARKALGVVFDGADKLQGDYKRTRRSPRNVVEEMLALWQTGATAMKVALGELAPFVTEASGDRAASQAGQLLVSLYWSHAECSARMNDIVKDNASESSAFGDIVSEGKLAAEGRRFKFDEKVGLLAGDVLASIPGPLLSSRVPDWQLGHLCVRVLALEALRGEAREVRRKQAMSLGSELFPRLRLGASSDGMGYGRATALASSCRRLGDDTKCVELLEEAIARHRSALEKSSFDPETELIEFELATELAQSRCLAGPGEWKSKLDGRRRAWLEVRDRLLTRWPYDLRGPAPAAPSGPMARAVSWDRAARGCLENARHQLLWDSADLGVPVPAEPGEVSTAP